MDFQLGPGLEVTNFTLHIVLDAYDKYNGRARVFLPVQVFFTIIFGKLRGVFTVPRHRPTDYKWMNIFDRLMTAFRGCSWYYVG